MITQAILDFLRDCLVNFVDGVNSLTSGLDLSAAGAAIGGVAAQAGHFLALFIDPGVWPVVVSSFSIGVGVWITTAIIGAISRRAAGD